MKSLIFFGIFLIISWSSAQQACTTPNGKLGTCIIINQCAPLFELYQNRYRSPDETRLLRGSQCGQQDRKPKVCCESTGPPPGPQSSTCTTPDNFEGNCIGLYNCATLNQLLNLPKPLNPDIVTYLRQSACQGSDRYSVCCNDRTPSVAPNTQPTTPTRQPFTNVDSLLPPRDKCGVGSYADRIVGGEVAAIDEFPWLAIIEYLGKKNNILMSCGASLITQRYVLTAGHCVKGAVETKVGKPTNIRLGEFDKSNNGPDCVRSIRDEECNDPLVIIPIEKIIPHPGYMDVGAPKDDIALIRMEREAPYTYFIRPICLPLADVTLGLANRAINFTVAGWGTTETGRNSNKKLYVVIPFVNKATCQTPYVAQTQLWDKQICAGADKGRDSCRGDSGGPLMQQKDADLYELIGVVSFGPTPCGKEGSPGVYTKVFSYLDWIKGELEP